MLDELLAGEIFYWLKEAQGLIEMWRRHCNTVRPHNWLDDRPRLQQPLSVSLPSFVIAEHSDWYIF
jgi:hypothetical protein